MASAATITSISRRHPSRLPSTRIRASRGSSGSAAIDRPVGVSRGRSPVAGVQRAQLGENGDAVGDLPAVGRIEEREHRDVAQVERRHLQDHRGQRGAGDLRVGEFRAGQEVVLRVQPDADPVGDPPAAPGALAGGGLRDRFDRQPLHLAARRVPGDPRRSRIDDVADTRHGQGGLGDVGGQHDPPAGVRREDLVLVGGGEPAVQRQHLGDAPPRGQVPAQNLCGVGDLTFAGEEDQDVPIPGRHQLVGRVADRLRLVDGLLPGPRGRRAAVHPARLGLLRRLVRIGLIVQTVWPITDLDRVGAAGHLDDGRVTEMPGEPPRVDGGRRDDQLQVGPAGQQLLEIAEQEVDVQAPLVGLVDDDRVVGPEHPVPDDLVQQDPVGHQLDQRVRAGVIAEPDGVADGAAHRGAGLLGDPLGQRPGRDPPWLGVPDRAAHPAADLQADLRQLGGFPGAGLAGHDDHLVRARWPRRGRRPDRTPAVPAGTSACGTAASRRAILASAVRTCRSISASTRSRLASSEMRRTLRSRPRRRRSSTAVTSASRAARSAAAGAGVSRHLAVQDRCAP